MAPQLAVSEEPLHRLLAPVPGLFVLAFVVLGGAAGPSAAAESFGESISVTEIQVPVTVLHRHEPVRGLTREDFVVTDDGEPREIVGFRVIDLSGLAGATDEEPAAGSGAGPGVETEGRRILVLFDLVFSRPHQLERALRGVQSMVGEQLHPADRVAVAYITVGGARLLLGFTSDAEAIDAALGAVGAMLDGRAGQLRENLDRLERREARSAPRNRARMLSERLGAAASVALLTGIETGDGPTLSLPYGPGGALAGAAIGDGERIDDPVAARVARTDPFQIGESLAAASFTSSVRAQSVELRRLLTLLRDVPSPKQVLFLSEGYGGEVLRTFGSSEAAFILAALDDLSETLRRAGWTLHAVDVGGIPDAFSGSGYAADSLLRLTEQSGGLLFEGYNRIELATEKLARRTSVTYVLTIRPDELPADGRLHELDVRLRSPSRGSEVLHRPGYYAPKPLEERSSLERQLDSVELLLGREEVREMEARVLARALPVDEGRAAVPVVVELPGSALGAALAPASGVRAGGPLGLEIQVYAVDADGGVQDLWLRRVGLDLETVGERLKRGGFRILGALDLSPGSYRIRVLVRESREGRVSLSTTPLTVTAPASGSLLAMEPVLVDGSGEWLELADLPEDSSTVAREVLSLDPEGKRSMVPAARPTVRPGDALGVLVVASGPEPVELSARIVNGESGHPASTAVWPLRQAPLPDGSLLNGLSRYLGRVATADLPPGRYDLEIRASGPGAAGTELRTVGFEVRGD